MLNPDDKESIISFYENRYNKLGKCIESVGWNDIESQKLRFKILCDIGDLNGAKICDVGCGFGDLSYYLENIYQKFEYLGVDISPCMIRTAIELYPKYNFINIDITNDKFTEKFDYILSSGALSYKIHNNMKYTKSALEKMFFLSKKGVAVNFLSSYVNYTARHNFHYCPEEIFSIAKKITKWVTIRHDYPLREFTLYMYSYPVF